MTKKLILLAAAILMVVSFSVDLQAQNRGHRGMMKHSRFGIHMAEKNMFPAHMLLRFKDEIGLSEAQVGKLEKMQEQFEEKSIRSKADVEVKQMKIQSYLKNDKIDRKVLEKMIRDTATLKTDIQIERMNYMLDIKSVLTADQLNKIETLKKEHREKRMEDRKGKRGQEYREKREKREKRPDRETM